MNIGIIGMGAVGSAISTYLYNAYKDKFYVLAKGQKAKKNNRLWNYNK